MPEYTVKSGKIRKDNVTYGPGDKIELSEEIARVLPQDRLHPLQVKGDPVPMTPAEPEPIEEDPPEHQPSQNEGKKGNKKGR